MTPFRSRHVLLASAIAGLGLAASASPIEEIVVRGDLRDSSLLDLPLSVTVIDQSLINSRTATHLEEVLNVAPNVNFSSGASRSRFFQIRGIGERGQFVEPLNPSVGVILDGIDLTGAATAATLFDVEQVEIFRGPQGTRYGANAHAGLIVLESRAPTATPEGALEFEAGNYGTRRIGAIASGPLAGETLTGRLAVQRHQSDGFMDNAFLGRSDTQNQDELTLRGRLQWLASERTRVDLSLARIEVDNGYDAFTFDNSRTTLTDEPGFDRQEADLASVRVISETALGFTVEASAGLAQSDLDYGFDVDWTFAGFHPAGFQLFDRYTRDRDTRSAELRLLSAPETRLFGGRSDWTLGVYHHRTDEDLLRTRTDPDRIRAFASAFETRRNSIYGQLDTALTDRLTLTTGLRYERRKADYEDSADVRFSPSEHLWGGRVGLEYLAENDALLYASISRGYKAGGFNTDGTLDADLREYDSEYVWNYELGAKQEHLDGRLTSQVALFFMDRRDQQVGTSVVRPRPDGSTEFIAFVDNAAKGRNYGLELELDWRASDRLNLSGSLGLLRTEFRDFVNDAGDDLDGRDQPHAPEYQFHLAARYDLGRGFFARLEAEGRDAFYFSGSHDERSGSYELLHARLGWEGARTRIALWGRNLTDKDYEVRGFGGFGNDPRDGYAPGRYVQFGAPRTFGLSARMDF